MTRLTIVDEGYGWICPDCGGFKWEQSVTCKACWKERQRPADYWTRRTCGCGAAKSPKRETCRACRDRKMIGNQHAAGRTQRADHPWRKAA